MKLDLTHLISEFKAWRAQRRNRKFKAETNKRRWHVVFALWPRKIDDYVWVWLEFVWQKKTLNNAWYTQEAKEFFAYWEYRRFRDYPFEPGMNGANDE